MRKTQSIIFSILVLILIGQVFAYADHKVVEKVTVSVAPAKITRDSGTITTWISEDRVARIDTLNNTTTLIRRDIDPQQMFILLHDKKIILELDLPFELPENLEPAFAELRMDWTINRLPSEKKIGQWNCKRFMLSGKGPMRVEIEMWATVDTTINTRRFHAMLGESMKSMPIFMDMIDKLYSISPHFAIQTTTTIEQLGIQTVTTSTVESISELPIPEEVFQLPDDYERQQLDFSTYLSLIRKTKPDPEY